MVIRNTLKKLNENLERIDREIIKNVLIVYNEEKVFIGDTCIIFDKLKYVKSFFPSAKIDLSFVAEEKFNFYWSFLKANPNFNRIICDDWENVDFANYDLALCVTNQENELLHHLTMNYSSLLISNDINLAIASLIPKTLQSKAVFSEYKELRDVIDKGELPRELYISEEERDWADGWLESNGIENFDSLFILIDSASEREKLLDITVYFDVLTWMLTLPQVKVLVFDEKKIGKEKFYREWLGQDLYERMMFSNGLKLREDLALISSRYTKLVFGPCTGLLHCASSIYNNFLRTRLNPNLSRNYDAPLLLTYTGNYSGKTNSLRHWWNNAPLVNCVMIRLQNNFKKIFLLHELSVEEEESLKPELACKEYTSEILIDFLKNKLNLDKFYQANALR